MHSDISALYSECMADMGEFNVSKRLAAHLPTQKPTEASEADKRRVDLDDDDAREQSGGRSGGRAIAGGGDGRRFAILGLPSPAS